MPRRLNGRGVTSQGDLMPNTEIDYQSLYDEHGGFLWGYCYRLTGSSADAEDLVHDTFVRALEHPPKDTARPWRPWLVRVASNLRRDRWRRDQRRRYKGPWLPSPVATGEDAPPGLWVGLGDDVAGRYEAKESVTCAFLLALEALTPRQRAILLLRDVYDYSVAETASALRTTPGAVKTGLHRARRALAAYDARRRPVVQRATQAQAALGRLLAAFASRDTETVATLLAEDVRALHDSAGAYYAAKVPVVGRDRVTLLYSNITPPAEQVRLAFAEINGLPAVIGARTVVPPGFPPRFVLTVDVDAGGAVDAIYSVLAPDKLHGIRFPDAG